MPSAAEKIEFPTVPTYLTDITVRTPPDPAGRMMECLRDDLQSLESKMEELKSGTQESEKNKEDQKTIQAKLDATAQQIVFAEELLRKFDSILDECNKELKSIQRRSEYKRRADEVQKIKFSVQLFEVLNSFGTEQTRNDFLNGTNGASVIQKEDLTYLDEFFKIVAPSRAMKESSPSYDELLTMASWHILRVGYSKSQKVVGTTYRHLKELFDSILECHYLDRLALNEDEATAEINGEEEEEEGEEEVVCETVAVPDAENDKCNNLTVNEVNNEVAAPVEKTTEFETHNNYDNCKVEEKALDSEYMHNTKENNSASENTPPTLLPPSNTPGSNESPIQPIPVLQQAAVPPPTSETFYVSMQHAPAPPAPAFANQQPVHPRPISDFVGSAGINFLQDSQLDLDSPHMDPAIVRIHGPTSASTFPQQEQPHPAELPPSSNFPQAIPTQTFTNQTFTSVQRPLGFPNMPQPHLPSFNQPFTPAPAVPNPSLPPVSEAPVDDIQNCGPGPAYANNSFPKVGNFSAPLPQQTYANKESSAEPKAPSFASSTLQSQSRNIFDKEASVTFVPESTTPPKTVFDSATSSDWNEQITKTDSWADSSPSEGFMQSTNGPRSFGSNRGNRGNRARGNVNGYSGSGNRGRNVYQNGRSSGDWQNREYGNFSNQDNMYKNSNSETGSYHRDKYRDGQQYTGNFRRVGTGPMRGEGSRGSRGGNSGSASVGSSGMRGGRGMRANFNRNQQ